MFYYILNIKMTSQSFSNFCVATNSGKQLFDQEADNDCNVRFILHQGQRRASV